MFTFSDGGEPQGYIAVAAEGIHMANKFKFNNSCMWTDRYDNLTHKYFQLGEDNFSNFNAYIQTQNKMPVSLCLTQEILKKR